MKERTDIAPPLRAQDRYNFDGLTKGASWHVETNEERCRVLAAFKYWASNIKRVPAKAISARVDKTDPDGPGFRIWFISTRKAPAPTQTTAVPLPGAAPAAQPTAQPAAHPDQSDQSDQEDRSDQSDQEDI